MAHRWRLGARVGFLALLAFAGCGKKEEADAVPGGGGIAVTPDFQPAPVIEHDPDNTAPDPETVAKLDLIRRMRWISMAAEDFLVHNGSFPAGTAGPDGEPGLSWRVQLLPYLGHDDLYKQFKLDEAWDGPTNKPLLAKMPKVFHSPKNPAPQGKTYIRAFKGFAFIPSSSGSNRTKPKPGSFFPGQSFNTITDGTSNTLLALEASEPGEWTRPDDFPLAQFAGGKEKEPTFPKLGAAFPGEFFALNITGDVFIFPTSVPPKDMLAFVTPGGGEQLSKAFSDSIKSRPKPWQRLPIRVPGTLPDAKARKQAVENYRDITKALHTFASKNKKRAPAGIAGTRADVGLSWRVQLLPELGEEQLYKQFKLDEPWDSDHNKTLIEKMPKVFASPGRAAPLGHTSVRGPNHTFMLQGEWGEKPRPVVPGQPLLGAALFTPEMFPLTPASKQFLLVESEASPWTKPDELPLPAFNALFAAHLAAKPPPLGGPFEDGFHAIMGDGRVTFYKNGYPPTHVMRMFLGSFGSFDPLADEDNIPYSIPAPTEMFPILKK